MNRGSYQSIAYMVYHKESGNELRQKYFTVSPLKIHVFNLTDDLSILGVAAISMKYTVNLRISPRGKLIYKNEFLGGGLF